MQHRTLHHETLAAEIQRQLLPSLSAPVSDLYRPAVSLTAPQWRTVETALRSLTVKVAPKPRVDPASAETGFMVVAAVRYSLGRPANAPELCTAWLKTHWPSLRDQDRTDIQRDIERFVSVGSDAPAEDRSPALQPWQDFLDWIATDEEPVPEERLAPLARYRLEILSRGPRHYASSDPQILALERRGMIEPTGRVGKDERREWAITSRGRATLAAQPT